MNPTALLALISSLYEQLATAQQQLQELRAAQSPPRPEATPFAPCDPADGPRSA